MVEQLIREGSKFKIPVHRKTPISLLLLPKLRKLFISEKPILSMLDLEYPLGYAF